MRRTRENPGDGYDGHSNYRDDFEPKPAGEVLRAFVRGLLAIAVCVTTTRLVYTLSAPDSAVTRIIIGLFAGVAGLIAGCLAYPMLHGWRNGESRPWTPLDAVAAAYFVFLFAIPYHLAQQRDQRRELAQLEQERIDRQERARYQERRNADAVDKLRRSGNYAEPGVVPPGLHVVDEGATVTVTNNGDHFADVSLSRVLVDAGSPGGWKGCALWTGGFHNEGRYHGHVLRPGMSLTFSMYGDCIEEFRDAPLEFRVGNPLMSGEAGERAWWSSSAFAFPEGREAETMRRLANARSPGRKPVSTPEPVAQRERSSEVEIAAEAEPELVAKAPATTSDIIKCRDSKGAVQFTQSYCPPGTTRVEQN